MITSTIDMVASAANLVNIRVYVYISTFCDRVWAGRAQSASADPSETLHLSTKTFEIIAAEPSELLLVDLT